MPTRNSDLSVKDRLKRADTPLDSNSFQQKGMIKNFLRLLKRIDQAVPEEGDPKEVIFGLVFIGLMALLVLLYR